MWTSLFLKQPDETRFSIRQWLVISCCFSCMLFCIRVASTGYFTYGFLVWNLFLAFIPYAISEWLCQRPAITGNRGKLVFILLPWLLFIPNSFYIVTDLFHLDQFDNAPKWFDLLLIFSFAWNGILFGIISVRRIESMLQQLLRRRFSLLFVLAVMWLNAFGIYLGRYLRFNSWDIITQPFSLFNQMIQVVIHPLQNKTEWGMIIVWALFMMA